MTLVCTYLCDCILKSVSAALFPHRYGFGVCIEAYFIRSSFVGGGLGLFCVVLQCFTCLSAVYCANLRLQNGQATRSSYSTTVCDSSITFWLHFMSLAILIACYRQLDFCRQLVLALGTKFLSWGLNLILLGLMEQRDSWANTFPLDTVILQYRHKPESC